MAEDLAPETDRWNVQTETRVRRTAGELTKCVRPLLHLSRQVLFVDPHFAPDTARYQKSLEAFLTTACENGRRYKTLEYHTKLQGHFEDDSAQCKGVDRFRQECEKHLPCRIPKGITLSVVLWDEKPDGDEMHARYVMTERGAIRIDKGLDIGRPNQTTDASLVAPDVHRKRWSDFQRGATTYTCVERLEIEGTWKP